MTKSRGIGRGGRREGAGRPPQGVNALRGLRTKTPMLKPPGAFEPQSAHDMLAVVVATLADVAEHSTSDRSRVAAARLLIRLGRLGLLPETATGAK